MSSYGKPPIAKGQPWPKSKGKPLELYLAKLRDEQPIVLVCGIHGCLKSYAGRFAQARAKLSLHRYDKHPDWTPPKKQR